MGVWGASDCNQGLAQAEEVLIANLGIGEKRLQALTIEELNRANDFERIIELRGARIPAETEPPQHLGARPLGQKLKKWDVKVRLDGKVTVGRLHQIALADASNLAGHARLLGGISDVLDDRIGKDEVELIVVELLQIASIPYQSGDPRLATFLRALIEQRNCISAWHPLPQ
jgi:hypothetical protein